MKCNRCGATIQADDTFCPECGAKLNTVLKCRYCSSPLDAGDTFCGGCGKAVISEKQQTVTREAPVATPTAPPPEPTQIQRAKKTQKETTQYVPPPIRYAGFWARFFALLLDFFFVPIIFSPLIGGAVFLGYYFGSMYVYVIDPDYIPAFAAGAGLLTYSLVFFFYFLIGHSFGSTIGKRIVGIRLVTFNGSNPGFWRALLRETIGRFLASFIFYLGYLWIAWDSHKQGWHDKVAGTFCIRTR
ncbi:MAG: RDD family protein [Candidatus Cloacimonadota bacterium]|nr:MAG: RDD family protein [Candidatus Cloacimonadota bacterium]